MKPGRPTRIDCQYTRNGVASLFMMFAPLEGWRRVKVIDPRTAVDYAHVLKDLADVHFAQAATIVLVPGQPLPHRLPGLPAAEAKRPLYLRPIEADIAGLDLRIGERREPYSAQHALLMQIPGVDCVVAAVQIAEIGVDMSVFLSVYHLAAWAGVCPAIMRAPAARRAVGARKGNVHVSAILVGAAISASARRRNKRPAGALAQLAQFGVRFRDFGQCGASQIK